MSARLKGEEDQLSAKHQLAVKGLSECKASESNFRCIQVKDIVKEVKDYLKTYSSAGMDISWYVEGIRWGLRTVRGGNTLTILLLFEKEQAKLKLFSKLALGGKYNTLCFQVFDDV
ncbi:hypothetical protein Tco_1332740, partial [Tanacetum coccineum]